MEEAVRLVEAHGGETVVMTLGPAEAADQLRDARRHRRGACRPPRDRRQRLGSGRDRRRARRRRRGPWRPTAGRSTSSSSATNRPTPAATRSASDWPSPSTGRWSTGPRRSRSRTASSRRGARPRWAGRSTSSRLPAVVGVREGINLPRYPSVPGRLRAKRKEIERIVPERRPGGPELIRLSLPVEQAQEVEILGRGPEAAPRVVEVLREIGVL